MVGDFDLRPLLWGLFILGALIGLAGWGVSELIDDDSIKTKHLITPEIQLTITDNKVDTIYVYREGKEEGK